MRNHSDPETVSSRGTPFYICVSGRIGRNIAQLSHLVVSRTDGRKALVPKRSVARNFRRYGCKKLRRRCRVRIDKRVGEIVPKHLASAGKRKRLKRHISLAEHFERLGVGCVGQECCA
jgi:hypothetical protein